MFGQVRFLVVRRKNERRRSQLARKDQTAFSSAARCQARVDWLQGYGVALRKQLLSTEKTETPANSGEVEKLNGTVAFRESDANMERLWQVCETLNTGKKDTVARICFRMGLAAIEKFQAEGVLK